MDAKLHFGKFCLTDLLMSAGAGSAAGGAAEAAGGEAAAVLLEQDAVAAGRHLGARAIGRAVRGAALRAGGPLCADRA